MNQPFPFQDPSCMDDFDPNSLPPAAALQRMLDAIQPLSETEGVAIRAALGRVLAADVRSSIDVPSGTNSAMDGYAVRADDIPAEGTRKLRVIGTAFAGKPLQTAILAGQAARIMTGALMPEGSDTIVIQERAEQNDDAVIIGPGTPRGENVREAGEDIKAGDVVVQAGQRLSPAELGLLASLGIGTVEVVRRPRVAFFSTGDELRSVGEKLETGQIYDSNRYTLHGMLTRLGAEIIDLGVVRDERPAIEQALQNAASRADAIITSGGVSVGEADYIKEILLKVGTVEFWKVAMKPGRPLAFGRVDGAWFFGLPGNPVSVMVTFYQFVQPALRRLMGEQDTAMLTIRVPCTSKLKKRPGRIEYQRGILERDRQGQLSVRKTGAQGSGILSSMSQANCFIILPMESKGVEPGAVVDVQPFFGIV